MSGARAADVLPRLDIAAASDSAGPDPPGPVLQTWHDGDGRVVASGGRDQGTWWMHWRGLATYAFGREGLVDARPAPGATADHIRDTFVRGVLPVVMLARGCEAFHASAVADDRGVVMLCATSGTGKSTTALAVAHDGVDEWADDSVVYELQGDRALALSLPFHVRVDREARQALSDPRVVPAATAGDRRPLRRVYHLIRDSTVHSAAPSFRIVPASERFTQLLAHAHPFDMDGEPRRRRFMETLLAVARTVDVWECRFAPWLPDLPAFARALRLHMREQA